MEFLACDDKDEDWHDVQEQESSTDEAASAAGGNATAEAPNWACRAARAAPLEAEPRSRHSGKRGKSWVPKGKEPRPLEPFKVSQSLIGLVIGVQGQTLKSIQKETGVRIDVDQSSKAKGYSMVTLKVARSNGDVAAARRMIEAIIEPGSEAKPRSNPAAAASHEEVRWHSKDYTSYSHQQETWHSSWPEKVSVFLCSESQVKVALESLQGRWRDASGDGASSHEVFVHRPGFSLSVSTTNPEGWTRKHEAAIQVEVNKDGLYRISWGDAAAYLLVTDPAASTITWLEGGGRKSYSWRREGREEQSLKRCSSEMRIDRNLVGYIIGRGGETIKQIKAKSKAKVWFDEATKQMSEASLCFEGTEASIAEAKVLVKQAIAWEKEKASKAPGEAAKEREQMRIEQTVVGLIIGPSGETLKWIQSESKAHLNMDQSSRTVGYSTLTLTGTGNALSKAKALVSEFISGKRTFDTVASDSDDIVCHVDQRFVGLLIGPGGQSLRDLKQQSGAVVLVDQTTKHEGYSVVRIKSGVGAAKARQLLNERLANCKDWELQLPKNTPDPPAQEVNSMREELILICLPFVDTVLGHDGDMLDWLKRESGASLKFDPPVAGSSFRKLRLNGRREDVAAGRALVQQLLDDAEAGAASARAPFAVADAWDEECQETPAPRLPEVEAMALALEQVWSSAEPTEDIADDNDADIAAQLKDAEEEKAMSPFASGDASGEPPEPDHEPEGDVSKPTVVEEDAAESALWQDGLSQGKADLSQGKADSDTGGWSSTPERTWSQQAQLPSIAVADTPPVTGLNLDAAEFEPTGLDPDAILSCWTSYPATGPMPWDTMFAWQPDAEVPSWSPELQWPSQERLRRGRSSSPQCYGQSGSASGGSQVRPLQRQSRGSPQQVAREDHYECVTVPQCFVGWLIGKGGCAMAQVKEATGARLEFDQGKSEDGFSMLHISGPNQAVGSAREIVEEKLRFVKQLAKNLEVKRATDRALRVDKDSGKDRSRDRYAHGSHGGLGHGSHGGVAAPTRLLRAALSALLGRWYGEAAEGQLRCYEVSLQIVDSKPCLACRSWIAALGDLEKSADGKELTKPIRFQAGDIFLGDQSERLYLDVVTDKFATWCDVGQPCKRCYWSRCDKEVRKLLPFSATPKKIRIDEAPDFINILKDDFPELHQTLKDTATSTDPEIVARRFQ